MEVNTETLSSPILPGPELAVIVPTFNERENVRELVQRLVATLGDVSWEVIFVDDDSPDGTAALVRELNQKDNRIRCIQRVGRRGLSTACIEGMLASSAPYLAVIDGDLQHDETILPQMLAKLKKESTDLVIGTRYASGGSIGQWDESRALISRFANKLSQVVLRTQLSDPMSGFFMVRREFLESCVNSLSGMGFKILVDMVASAPGTVNHEEVPYRFRNRKAGESKLDGQAAWDFGMLLLDKIVGRFIPARFIAFCLIGGFGVVIHLAILGIFLKGFDVDFTYSQSIATVVAMTGNFALNNEITYRDKQLRGVQWLKGWMSFCLACSVGAFANVGIASYLFSADTQWILASLAGILVGTVWNFAITSVYTWRAAPSNA
jgi:dolichol-phosphate mannosyltransferase